MKGFTLIEVLVVMAITVMMTGLLVTNFSRSRVDLNQTRLLVQDAIREAQSLALSGSLYQGTYRCGYGIHFAAGTYTIFAAPNAESVDCTTLDRRLTGEDEVVRVGLISNPTVELVLPIPDIFFEPPQPTTYIDNSSAVRSLDISIRRGGAACPSSDCRQINVSTSGLITTK